MSVDNRKTTFALFFGTRNGFPGALMASARDEMSRTLTQLGHEVLMLDENATAHGGVCSLAEGRIYADWLKSNEGKFDGVILCLPNFGDENGAVAALKHANVPILVQAYPDEMDKMSPALRRDAFCGKLSVMDVFRQNGVKFTALKPHTVSPLSKTFADNVDYFDRICRVVKGVKEMHVGAFGARTTDFKTVRIDELALQSHGITMETFDLSSIFAQTEKVSESESAFKAKAERLTNYTDFSRMPKDRFAKLVQLAVVIDNYINDYKLDAVALRCWIEMQSVLGVSVCVLLSELNDRMITASCELDVANAITMYAGSLASGQVSACLDWNNNYYDDENKCILFHCGPVPQTMMTSKGCVTEHGILGNVEPPERTFGCNVGRIKPGQFTFSSMMTEKGNLKFYMGEGGFTSDPIAEDFFGCAGVAEIPNLQDVLLHIAKEGHRHHVSVTPGTFAGPFGEALSHYLGYEVHYPQGRI
ncbi:hypothetical protein LLG39_05105 [bacterium]|nr:hypothetical protein [bacterium]